MPNQNEPEKTSVTADVSAIPYITNCLQRICNSDQVHDSWKWVIYQMLGDVVKTAALRGLEEARAQIFHLLQRVDHGYYVHPRKTETDSS